MAASAGCQWRRDTDGLGVWEHRGRVAVAGVGHSPVDRRWGGGSMVLIADLRSHLGKARVDAERRRDGGIA
jgi:hypothetical protein